MNLLKKLLIVACAAAIVAGNVNAMQQPQGAQEPQRSLKGTVMRVALVTGVGYFGMQLANHLTVCSGAPEQFDEQRWTLGLNYWLAPSSVVKVAYQFDNRNAGEKDRDAFLAQFAIGF